MTLQEEIAAMKSRIAKADADRDTWRATGSQERYLEAHSMVDALELQLARLQGEARRLKAKK